MSDQGGYRSGGGLRVLLVDDEAAILRVVARSLTGCQTVSVESVDGAIERLANERFDVVISDNSMPGKCGVELLEHVAEHHPSVRRVMHSGSQPDGLDELERRGVIEHFVAKPGYGALAAYCRLLCEDVAG